MSLYIPFYIDFMAGKKFPDGFLYNSNNGEAHIRCQLPETLVEEGF